MDNANKQTPHNIMKLNFKGTKSYQTAKTLLGGNDYKFAYYRDELSIRFYTYQMYLNALSALAEIGIREIGDFAVDTEDYRLPALENGWSVG